MSLSALCAAENATNSCPILLEYLLTEVVARGGGACEGLFRLSVAGAVLAEHAVALSNSTPGVYDVRYIYIFISVFFFFFIDLS